VVTFGERVPPQWRHHVLSAPIGHQRTVPLMRSARLLRPIITTAALDVFFPPLPGRSPAHYWTRPTPTLSPLDPPTRSSWDRPPCGRGGPFFWAAQCRPGSEGWWTGDRSCLPDIGNRAPLSVPMAAAGARRVLASRKMKAARVLGCWRIKSREEPRAIAPMFSDGRWSVVSEHPE